MTLSYSKSDEVEEEDLTATSPLKQNGLDESGSESDLEVLEEGVGDPGTSGNRTLDGKENSIVAKRTDSFEDFVRRALSCKCLYPLLISRLSIMFQQFFVAQKNYLRAIGRDVIDIKLEQKKQRSSRGSSAAGADGIAVHSFNPSDYKMPFGDEKAFFKFEETLKDDPSVAENLVSLQTWPFFPSLGCP